MLLVLRSIHRQVRWLESRFSHVVSVGCWIVWFVRLVRGVVRLAGGRAVGSRCCETPVCGEAL